jgi:glycosyltransferase involved in cell wall biosynthesis
MSNRAGVRGVSSASLFDDSFLKIMRILLVSHYLPPNGNGGVENYTIALAKFMAEQGHNVTVYARGTNTELPNGTEQAVSRFGDTFSVIEAHPGTQSLGSHPRINLHQSSAFKKLLQKIKPDIVHFQHLLYHSMDYPQIAKSLGAATVLTLHDFWLSCPTVQRLDYAGNLCDRPCGVSCLPCVWSPHRERLLSRPNLEKLIRHPIGSKFVYLLPAIDELEDWGEVTRRCLANIDCVISPSKFLAQHFADTGIAIERLKILDNGLARQKEIDLLLPPSLDTATNPKMLRFGVIGTHHLKGIHIAIEAFRQLSSEVPARLLFYGIPPDGLGLTLPDNTEGRGRFGAEDIERVYASFDILIVPSIWYENAPIVIREAFARHKPVITSNIGGMAESVRDGIDGLHFPVGDAKALAACVRNLVENPDLVEQLRSGIEPPMYLDEHLSELEKVYFEICPHLAPTQTTPVPEIPAIAETE